MNKKIKQKCGKSICKICEWHFIKQGMKIEHEWLNGRIDACIVPIIDEFQDPVKGAMYNVYQCQDRNPDGNCKYWTPKRTLLQRIFTQRKIDGYMLKHHPEIHSTK